jgi:aminopeptidase N
MKNLLIGTILFFSAACLSQTTAPAKPEFWKSIYRATPEKINDLIHTKLDVNFDFTKSWMYGKAWITLKPHFYPTDSLNLDAKGMDIKEVSIVKTGKNIPLKYIYDGQNLRITLDKTYRGGESYTVYIDYVSKPNDLKVKGSAAISNAKGLYFINPSGADKEKPVQIWTQGETEANSAWVPTIDKPNQKTTDEISMTVPSRYKTLSNGLLVKQKNNSDRTRTDTWKMDLPHAPYLMMMAVGEYSVIKDSYKGKEVSYYVEKDYGPVARKIFGFTPEMIGFYSKVTGVDFPWQKYGQVVVRDYVSGAMENTTATVHAESAQQDSRQLADGNEWEDVIAHELFHMWFGDYVTAESWSNLTINESFADFSEVLWEEYKHGKEAGDEHNFNSMQNYLFSNSSKKDLVRFYYNDREDMFDAVSYMKGGRILNMLRTYVGDTAFYKSMNLFLIKFKFKSAEAQDLRLVFEEVTGKDLNWFWNQWYYGSGHPILEINYNYDQPSGIAKVFVKQTQPDKVFILPVAIDVYQGGMKRRYNVWLDHQADTFMFPVLSKPDLINVDGDKILLCEKTDNKSLDNYIFQYKNAGLYLDRREAIEFAVDEQSREPKAAELLINALSDPFPGLRELAVKSISLRYDMVKVRVEPILADLAVNDPSPLVRAGAIRALGNYKKDIYKELFMKSVNDSSYTVAGGALIALESLDSVTAFLKAKEFSAQKIRGALSEAVTNILFANAGDSDFESLAGSFDKLTFWSEKLNLLRPFSNYLKHLNNSANFKKGIDMIITFIESIPEEYRQQFDSYINGMILNDIVITRQSMGLTEDAEYVRTKIVVKSPVSEVISVPPDLLSKYAGEYDLNGNIFKVTVKDNKTLFIVFPGQSEMELTPVSKTVFAVKFMEENKIEFVTNDKGEITGLLLKSEGEEIKATRKK